MKARIVFCEIWEDPDVSFLAKHLCVYFWTTTKANLIGLYKTTNEYTSIETGYSDEEIEVGKKELEKQKRVHFFENCVYLPNSQDRCGYKNKDKYEKAVERQVKRTPDNALEHFRNLGYTIPCPWPSVAHKKQKPKTNKKKIVNSKQKNESNTRGPKENENIDMDDIDKLL